MEISRRALLAGAAAATALAGCSGRTPATVDVRSFEARGDGVTDDSGAIQSAVGALRSGDTLHFPSGTYRFAQHHPPGDAAISLTGLANVAVEFDPGAELLMDNLDPATHTGTSHGVLVHGPASGIMLRGVNIRWAQTATRSFGDGIRVQGRPGPHTGWSAVQSVSGVTLSDCAVRASPQAGVIMMGVSDIDVSGLRVADTGADGLHFNACRRARVDDYGAVDTGDDGLALVTYFAETPSFDDAAHTFAFPSLTEWSNTDFVVTGVDVAGGSANGVRIAGAHRVTVGGVRVDGVRSGAAVMVDSAEPGADVGWNYVASRGVRVGDLTATHCDTGFHLLARPGAAGDQRFTDFDVHVDGARVDDCSNWSVRAESLTERRVSGLRLQNCTVSASSTTGGNGGVGIGNAQGISLSALTIRHTESVVALHAVNAGPLAVDRLSVSVNGAEQPAASPCVSLDGSELVPAVHCS
ncbi:MAG: glycosyl hydrolase family 28-related protein [Mycobacterium sp.]